MPDLTPQSVKNVALYRLNIHDNGWGADSFGGRRPEVAISRLTCRKRRKVEKQAVKELDGGRKAAFADLIATLVHRPTGSLCRCRATSVPSVGALPRCQASFSRAAVYEVASSWQCRCGAGLCVLGAAARKGELTVHAEHAERGGAFTGGPGTAARVLCRHAEPRMEVLYGCQRVGVPEGLAVTTFGSG